MNFRIIRFVINIHNNYEYHKYIKLFSYYILVYILFSYIS